MGRMVAQIPNEDPERLKRVLDAKWRTIGVDQQALEAQVAERKAQEAAERERIESHAKLTNYFQDQLTIQQQEADAFRRHCNENVNNFRETEQLKHTRREWDLNRPDAKLVDSPARVGDDDPRIGLASMQRFDGEDLSAADRAKAQGQQCQEWWDEQQAQRDALKAAQDEAEKAHAELMRLQDLIANTSKAEEAAIRRELNKATAELNKRLAEEKRLRDQMEKQAIQSANLAEMEATITSAWMTEDPNTSASAMSQYRVRKDHYKGMTEAERKAILDTQLAQMEEAKARRERAAMEEAMYARTQADIGRALDEQARRVDEFKKQQAERSADILKKQQEEKNNRDNNLNELYRNKLAPEYFLQFGTSHR